METSRPRVSIGLPVYNGEKYLAQALDSILGQTYGDFELIISDNCSTDRTPAICRAYCAQDSRIRLYRNHQNLGAAPNFNQVFRLSRGEYFKWAAYDDLIAPDFLARCVEVLDRDRNVVLCFARSKVIDEHGRVIGESDYNSDTGAPQPHYRFQNLALNLANTSIPVWGLMRADVVSQTGLIGGYPSADLVFLAELALYGPFHQIPEPLFVWRDHPEQSTKGELRVERDRMTWFDTSTQDKVVFPKWLLLFGYLCAIGGASLTTYQRTYCLLQMLRWVLVPAHLRALGKDVLMGGAGSLRRSITGSRPLPSSERAV
jgi:glycosyltransferase involved in cell wall biosynthesis